MIIFWVSYLRDLSLTQSHTDFLLYFLSEVLLLGGFTFRSKIYCEYIWSCSARYVSKLVFGFVLFHFGVGFWFCYFFVCFLHFDIQLFQDQLLKRQYLFLNCLCTFVKNQLTKYVCLFLGCTLFH